MRSLQLRNVRSLQFRRCTISDTTALQPGFLLLQVRLLVPSLPMFGVQLKTQYSVEPISSEDPLAGAVMAALHGPNPVLLREMIVRLGPRLNSG